MACSRKFVIQRKQWRQIISPQRTQERAEFFEKFSAFSAFSACSAVRALEKTILENILIVKPLDPLRRIGVN